MCRASKRLYFLKQHKRAGVPVQQLLHFYVTVIRPVLEYCAPVWHYAITRSQAEQLESIQKRAIHIIYPFTRGMSYSNLNLPPLNPGVTNFQGHSFKISLSHSLPSIIYSPLYVIRLSCLGSEQPHGFHVLSHAPKNIAPLLITP